MNRREAFAALAGLAMTPGVQGLSSYPDPGGNWSTWTEAADDMARFERRAIRDYRRLRAAGVPWLEPYQAPGVIHWRDDVSLVFATSNHDGDVSDLLDAAVDQFHRRGVTVLGSALTDCRSVGCAFVWRSKGDVERLIWEWVEC